MMANIGGNINGIIQIKSMCGVNAIGEAECVWTDAFTHIGWLGMESGGMRRDTYKTKLEESTHVFMCDYHEGIYSLAAQDTRMIIKGFVYDVLMIDNPDEMCEQLEIYLKRVGASHAT